MMIHNLQGFVRSMRKRGWTSPELHRDGLTMGLFSQKRTSCENRSAFSFSFFLCFLGDYYYLCQQSLLSLFTFMFDGSRHCRRCSQLNYYLIFCQLLRILCPFFLVSVRGRGSSWPGSQAAAVRTRPSSVGQSFPLLCDSHTGLVRRALSSWASSYSY